MQDDTARIRRDELADLLDTTRSVDDQRVTAEMPAMLLDDLLQPESLPPEIVVIFKTPAPSPRRRIHQMAASFAEKIGWRRTATPPST